MSKWLLPVSLGVIYDRKYIIQLSKRLYMYLLESTYTFYISLVEWASVQTFFLYLKHFIYIYFPVFPQQQALVLGQ